MREIEEPRPALGRARLAQEFERVIGEDVGHVELPRRVGELSRRARGQTRVGGRVPLVVGMGLQVPVAVIGVEAPQDRTRHAHVPLAHHPGAVTGTLEQLGDGDVVVEEVPRVGLSPTRRGLRRHEIADAGLMGMQPRHEGGARRTAAGRGVDLLEAGARLGEPVKVRRGNLTPVAPQVGITEVVRQDDQNVGSPRGPAGQGGQEEGKEADRSHRGHGIVATTAFMTRPFNGLNSPIRAPKRAGFRPSHLPLGGSLLRSALPPWSKPTSAITAR